MMFSSPSYAEWIRVGEDIEGNIFYVDAATIKKQNGYIYWWVLQDWLKPTQNGMFSGQIYFQGSCSAFRYRIFSDRYFNQPMGRGAIVESSNTPEKQWSYPKKNSSGMDSLIFQKVCNAVGK